MMFSTADLYNFLTHFVFQLNLELGYRPAHVIIVDNLHVLLTSGHATVLLHMRKIPSRTRYRFVMIVLDDLTTIHFVENVILPSLVPHLRHVSIS